MGKHYSNRPSFKEKNYKAKFLTSSIIKKMKSTKIILKNKNKKKDNFGKKTKKKRKKRKIHVGNGKKTKKKTCGEWKKNEKTKKK
jgi:hypothetical protein